MAKLRSVPESSSYNLTFGNSALRTELDGGRGRYRADILNASTMLEGLEFRLDPEEYNYFMAFYRTKTLRASEPFEMDLLVDNSDYVECTCNFIPGSVRLTQQSGLTYVVGASVEVQQPLNVSEATQDNDIVDDYEAEHFP